MRIFVTGDTHGDFYSLAEFNRRMPELCKNDYVIVCGDFGLIWDYQGENGKEKFNKFLLDGFNFTTLFVCGNHENFDRLKTYPITNFKGGKVRKISDSIYYLMRGEMYNIYNNKIFTFGGARSHDIWNLLNPADKDSYEKINSFYREVGISWWEDEIGNAEELRHGWETLKNNNWECDYIISHEAPQSDALALQRYGGIMGDYLESIKEATDFKIWYYGHHHLNASTGDKMQCLFSDILELGQKRATGIYLGEHKKKPFSQRQLLQIIDEAKKERKKVLKNGWDDEEEWRKRKEA